MVRDFIVLLQITRTYARRKAWVLILAIFVGFLYRAANVAAPFASKFVIDEVFLGRHPEMLLPLVIVAIGFLVGLLFTGWLRNYIQ